MTGTTTTIHLNGTADLYEMGEWLDQMMHNPPMPELQRWTFKTNSTVRESTVGILVDSFIEIEFTDKDDAFMFKLVWNNNVCN